MLSLQHCEYNTMHLFKEVHLYRSTEPVLLQHLKHALKGINHQRSDVKLHAIQALLLRLKNIQVYTIYLVSILCILKCTKDFDYS